MACVRCGGKKQIERHHIIQRIYGGNDRDDNLQDLCRPCHRYEHTKRICDDTLSRERQRGQSDRTVFLEHRLAVIEALNTPEIIRERGSYESYWIDTTARKIPRWIPNKKERVVEGIIQLALLTDNP